MNCGDLTLRFGSRSGIAEGVGANPFSGCRLDTADRAKKCVRFKTFEAGDR